MERPNEIPETVSYFSVEKPKSFFQRSQSALCICCTSFLIPALVAIVTSCLANKSCIAASTKGCGEEMVPAVSKISHAEKQTSPESLRSVIPWASFNLAQDRFYKGIERIPWTAGESESFGISLEDNHKIRIRQTGLYEIYSKITFEFTVENPVYSVYHTINLYSIENNSSILEKNIINVADKSLREMRTFQTSDLFTLRRLYAGDVITIIVSDTTVVYQAKLDNTVKIIKRA